MRKLILITLAFIFTFPLFAQDDKKNTVGITCVPFLAAVIYGPSNVDGGGSYNVKEFYNIGLEYSRTIAPNFELSSGASFSHYRIESEPSYQPGIDLRKQSNNLNFISVPILIKYKFLDYYFVNGGSVFNFKISDDKDNNLGDSNDKLGIMIGGGMELPITNDVVFSVNPYLQLNSILKSNFDFINAGIRIGLGYHF